MSWCWGNYAESINEASLALDHLKYQVQSTLRSHSNYQTNIHTQTDYRTNQDSNFQSLNSLNPSNATLNYSEYDDTPPYNQSTSILARIDQPPPHSIKLAPIVYQSNFPLQLNPPISSHQQVQHRITSSLVSQSEVTTNEQT